MIYVGTSGWLYSWNAGRSLKWYIEHSGLNAVELNASFYRIPTERQVKRWAEVGSQPRWAVKIHRSITHFSQLADLGKVKRFLEVFSPLDSHIDFYLFQMPPRYVKNINGKSGESGLSLGPHLSLDIPAGLIKTL